MVALGTQQTCGPSQPFMEPTRPPDDAIAAAFCRRFSPVTTRAALLAARRSYRSTTEGNHSSVRGRLQRRSQQIKEPSSSLYYGNTAENQSRVGSRYHRVTELDGCAMVRYVQAALARITNYQPRERRSTHSLRIGEPRLESTIRRGRISVTGALQRRIASLARHTVAARATVQLAAHALSRCTDKTKISQ